MRNTLQLLLLILALLLQSGCGLLLGNVKPVDEKSDSYGVADLSKESPDWVRLEQSPKTDDSTNDPKTNDGSGPSELPDVAFQSQKTAAVISLNSACRPSTETERKDLRNFTNLLLLGISNISLRDEKEITIQDTPALQTTIRGTLNGQPIALRTVVLKRKSCLYDITYIARPDAFGENEDTFSHFIASLRLK